MITLVPPPHPPADHDPGRDVSAPFPEVEILMAVIVLAVLYLLSTGVIL